MACKHGKLKNPVGGRKCKKAPRKAKAGRPAGRCSAGGYVEPIQVTTVRCWCPTKDGGRRRLRCPEHVTAAGRRAPAPPTKLPPGEVLLQRDVAAVSGLGRRRGW